MRIDLRWGCAALLLASVDAFAGGAYVGGAIGTHQATLNEHEEELAETARRESNKGGGASYTVNDWGYTARVYGGYWINEMFGVEAHATALGDLESELAYSRTDLFGFVSAQARNRMAVRLAALTLTGALPFGAQSGLVGRAGFARWRMQLDSERECAFTGTLDQCSAFLAQDGAHTAWGTGMTFGLGLIYRLTPELTARADWDRYNKVGSSKTGGRTDINALAVGLDYTFGESPLSRPSRWALDTRAVYYGAGLAASTLSNTDWGVGAQVFAGYATGFAVGRMALDAELGYLNTGDMDYDQPLGARVGARIMGPWLSALARLEIVRDWELLARAGGDFGDDGGLLLGVGGAYAVTRDTSLRLEYVLRENVDSVQLNVVYRLGY